MHYLLDRKIRNRHLEKFGKGGVPLRAFLWAHPEIPQLRNFWVIEGLGYESDRIECRKTRILHQNWPSDASLGQLVPKIDRK